jgi:transposase, IS5 family
MAKAHKNRASKQPYISPNQPTLVGFESPFTRQLNSNNRWVVLSHKIPWDTLVNVYQKQLNNSETGADGINPRVVIGSLIIKHMCDLSDRETVQQIQENIYMQYFIGYSSFSDEEPFDPSLFVEFRKRLGMEQINAINEKILHMSTQQNEVPAIKKEDPPSPPTPAVIEEALEPEITTPEPAVLAHKGKLIVDATACPQDIGYPTDLNLLNDSREKAEELIDFLFDPKKHEKKPRTYREKARKDYLKTAQKKRKTRNEIRNALRKQLCYLKRDIKSIYRLLDSYGEIPFDRHQYKYFLVIQTLYDQQAKMYQEKSHSVEHRLVSIHQPHVRPIVRGKTNANVEFGAKIQVSLMQGFAFLEDLSWEAFNEGTRLLKTVEQYKARLGYYPKEVLVDKIYCTRENRKKIQELGISLVAKPLGRPKAMKNHIRPGERNPIEGKFGQAKTAYGMNRIKARLQQTSESWIATIIMVLNLVKLTGQVSYWVKLLTYSAWCRNMLRDEIKKWIWMAEAFFFKKRILVTYSADPN